MERKRSMKKKSNPKKFISHLSSLISHLSYLIPEA